MTAYRLEQFIDDCERRADAGPEPADRVLAIAPLMARLLAGDRDFLRAEHCRGEPAHYARNAVRVAGDDEISLFALVWQPGQWTPVHDHGTWGVVGVVRGTLEERAYQRVDADHGRDEGIELRRGGVVLLTEGAVSSFVPNPDHIHMTGVAAGADEAISLHLYGRALNQFHIYDVAAGTRRLIDVPHFEA